VLRTQFRQLITLGAVAATFAILAAFAVFDSEGRRGVISAQATDPATAPPAAQQWFMRIEGVEGEATGESYKGWIEILSYEQSIERSDAKNSGASRRRGSAEFSDIAVTKELDKATPKLMEAIAKGKVFAKVEIHMTATYGDAGEQTYLAIELENVQVTSYSLSGSAAEGVPTEQVSLNFEEIKVTYSENDERGKSKGNVEFEWKVEEGES
jgi:type VI secretion system secreted protein Hcp